MLLHFLSLSVVILCPIPPRHPTHIKQIAVGFSMSAPPPIDEQVPTLISESHTVSLFNCRSTTCLFRSAYTTTYLNTPLQSFMLFLLPQTAFSLAGTPTRSYVGAHKHALAVFLRNVFALLYSLSLFVSVFMSPVFT